MTELKPMTLDLERERLALLFQREALRVQATQPLSLVELRGEHISDERVDRILAHRKGQAPGPGAALLAKDIEELERELAEAPSPLSTLARGFGLSDFERDALLLGLAPELDLRNETVLAYLNDDLHRRWPTVDLALRMFAQDDAARRSARSALRDEAPLFAEGLLEWTQGTAGSSLARGFVASTLAVQRLLGEPLGLPQGCRVLLPQSAAHDLRVERLAEAVVQELQAVLLFVSQPTSDPLQFGVDLSRCLARPMLVVDLGALLGRGAHRLVELRRIRLRARLEGASLYVRGAWEEEAPGWLETLCAGPPIFIETPARSSWRLSRLQRPATVVELLPTTAARRQHLWRTALTEEGVSVEEEALLDVSTNFELAPREIQDAAHHVRMMGGTRIPREALYEACKARLEHDLGSLATKVCARAGWEDLILPAQIERRLRELASAVRQRTRVFEQWGLGGRVGGGTGVTALFAGASGTGKTMAAGVVAREVGLDLYRLDLSCVVSKYIGETEKNLDRVFDAARRAGALLFFDEAEALLGKRSEVKDAHDRYSNIEVAFLLQRLEAHPGPVLFATNLAKNIDPAFARRLHFVIDFPQPDPARRAQIWARVLGGEAPIAPDVDFAFLAEGFATSGGQIRNIAVDAAFLAARDDRPICMKDLVGAMARQLRRDGKLPSRASFRQFQTLVEEELV